jgi:hypothetical protein
MGHNLLAALSPAPMNRLQRILLPIAVSTLLTEVAFAQGTTITSLNTQVTPGTPTTVTVAGASAPSAFAGQTLTLNYLGGDKTISSYVTSAGTFEAIQVAGLVTLQRNVSEPTPTTTSLGILSTLPPAPRSTLQGHS